MISVVIATLNEKENLPVCLKSLKLQTLKNFEVVVVDNFSTDGTLEIAKSFGIGVFSLGPERSEQRNFGAQEARGEFLLFIDADMELEADVVSSCLEKASEGFDAVVIPEISLGQGFWSDCRSLEKRLYFVDPSIEAPRFFKKSIFEKVGGYSPDLVSGEDWDLREKIKSLSAKIGRIDSLIYHHEGHLTLKRAFKKKFYYAKHARNYLRRNRPSLVTLLLFVFRPAFLRNVRYLFIDPRHFSGMLFLKTVELVAGALGFIYSTFL